MGAPDWVAADACQAFSLAGRVENSECASIANYVQWHFPARGKHPEMMAYFYDGGLQPPRPLSMPADMGMPGRGMMFVGENGRAGFGVLWRQSVAAGPYCDRSRASSFKDSPAAGSCRRAASRTSSSPSPPCRGAREPDHYAEWIRACKAGKKSIMPIEFACDFTEFALLGTATLRRYSAPARRRRRAGRVGGIRPVRLRGGLDSRVQRRPCSRPRRASSWRTRHRRNYYRSSKVLLWDCEGHEIHQRRSGQRPG